MMTTGEHTGLEKLALTSKDWTGEHIAQIGKLFPQVLTEDRDAFGRLRPAIDFDKLRDLLSYDLAQGRETYEFTWVGKREAIAEAGRVTSKTLRPDLAESVDFEGTENIFITGDNLEALKILQESYLGKVDMIYIDPPYNTGKDFVYSDKFSMDMAVLEEGMDLRDEEGRLKKGLTPNQKSSGRYHSDWLNMMYPRLVLARNLLADSGVIFISIDDNEQSNLKTLCDEIFGEENFRNSLLVRRRTKSLNVQFADTGLRTFNVGTETILVYSKSELTMFNPVRMKKGNVSEKGSWNVFWSNADRPSMRYDILDFIPSTGQWRWSKEKAEEAIENYKVFIDKFSDKLTLEEYSASNPDLKFIRRIENGAGKNGGVQYFVPPSATALRTSNWTDLEVSQIAKKYNLPFDNPKNVKLIMEILKTRKDKDTLILDFFAGSGTTADAVMQLNAEDGGKRRYILCTLDEETESKSAARAAGYATIDQISRERIRRAAKKILTDKPELAGQLDTGFRALRLDSSNYKAVRQRPASYEQGNLFDSISNIKEDRSEQDMLFETMLRLGLELSLPITSQIVAGATIYSVDDDGLPAMMTCFADQVPEATIRHMAEAQPLRAVFKDVSFSKSEDKVNLTQIFKELSPLTKVKVV